MARFPDRPSRTTMDGEASRPSSGKRQSKAPLRNPGNLTPGQTNGPGIVIPRPPGAGKAGAPISKGAIARRAGRKGVKLTSPTKRIPPNVRSAPKDAISRRRGMTAGSPGNLSEEMETTLGNLGSKIRLLAGARNKGIHPTR